MRVVQSKSSSEMSLKPFYAGGATYALNILSEVFVLNVYQKQKAFFKANSGEKTFSNDFFCICPNAY